MQASEFLNRWIDGIKNLSYERQLQAKVSGLWGTIIGLVAGLISLIVMKQYIWTIVIFFSCFLQVLELIRTKQELRAALQMQEKLAQLKLGA